MIEGICSKCGACYVGWSLRFPRNQWCTHCGATLKIYEDGKFVAGGYSPFTAEKYSLDLPSDSRSTSKSVKEVKQTEDTREKS